MGIRVRARVGIGLGLGFSGRGGDEDEHRALLQEVSQPADEPAPLERVRGEHLHHLRDVLVGVARLAHRNAHLVRGRGRGRGMVRVGLG